MKTSSILLLCAFLFGCSSHNESKVEPIRKRKTKVVSIIDDFVMGSATAVSNATLTGKPPEGWRIACDGNGHFAARSPSGVVIDGMDCQIRTNEFEAIVAAWRTKEIWDAIPSEFPTLGNAKPWKDCE